MLIDLRRRPLILDRSVESVHAPVLAAHRVPHVFRQSAGDVTRCRQHRRRIGSGVRPLVGLDSSALGAILDRMLSRPRSRPLSNFIEPCLPRRADKPPAGRDWIHEIKHDGFRTMARRDADGVRLVFHQVSAV